MSIDPTAPIYPEKDVALIPNRDEPYNPNDYPQIEAHERVHLRQQSQANLWSWYFSYVFNGSFRLKVESEAVAEEVIYCQEHLGKNLADWTLLNYAKMLSGWQYLWCASYNHALASLENAILKKQPGV